MFGWFSKRGTGEDKRIGKARKLEEQGRWAEALSYFEEVPGEEEARAGARRCRERLVELNLSEARAYLASDPAKAREHAGLALDLAGDHADLRRQAAEFLGSAPAAAPKAAARAAPVKPLFAGSCSCAAPCHDAECGEAAEEGDLDVEDLFAFYLDAAEPEERLAFEGLGHEFREGFVLLQQGDCAGARRHLEKAAEEDSGPGPLYALALLAAHEGRPKKAERGFRKALAADPAFGPAARHLAQTLLEAREGAAASALLRDWTAAHPADAEAGVLLVSALLWGGDPASAREEAERVRRLAPDDPRPSVLLAQALRLTGDPDGAIETLQGVVRRWADLVEPLALLGELLLAQGGTAAERAAELFKRCYQLDPDRGGAYLLKVAEAYAVRGWRPQAAEVLERAGRELPDTPEAREAWAAVHAKIEGGS